jgi:ATP-dependent RNA helicase DeaD
MQAVADVGYETPSPIQAATIPRCWKAATCWAGPDRHRQDRRFRLPVLSRHRPARSKPQALVLAPTRELAIQVAEAFQTYSAHMPGFRVLPVYGGQAYGPQLAACAAARTSSSARPAA